MNIRFYAENGIYILQARSLHDVFSSLVFMNDITPTHSVRCESTTEFPKTIVSMGSESLLDQQNSFIVYVLKITWLNGIIIHSFAWTEVGGGGWYKVCDIPLC